MDGSSGFLYASANGGFVKYTDDLIPATDYRSFEVSDNKWGITIYSSGHAFVVITWPTRLKCLFGRQLIDEILYLLRNDFDIKA